MPQLFSIDVIEVGFAFNKIQQFKGITHWEG
jgi:hypothetical protein